MCAMMRQVGVYVSGHGECHGKLRNGRSTRWVRSGRMTENMQTTGRSGGDHAGHGRVIVLGQKPGGTTAFGAGCDEPGGYEDPGESI